MAVSGIYFYGILRLLFTLSILLPSSTFLHLLHQDTCHQFALIFSETSIPSDVYAISHGTKNLHLATLLHIGDALKNLGAWNAGDEPLAHAIRSARHIRPSLIPISKTFSLLSWDLNHVSRYLLRKMPVLDDRGRGRNGNLRKWLRQVRTVRSVFHKLAISRCHSMPA